MDSYSILNSYDKYSEIVTKNLTWCWVWFFLIVVLGLGTVAFFIWWRIDVNEDINTASTGEQISQARIDNLKWYIFAVLISVLLSFAITSTISDITAAKYDIKNETYEIIDGAFSVKEHEWWGRWNRETYSIHFEKDGKMQEISPNLRDLDLPPGKYTNKILVYAEKSEIIVDIIAKE